MRYLNALFYIPSTKERIKSSVATASISNKNLVLICITKVFFTSIQTPIHVCIYLALTYINPEGINTQSVLYAQNLSARQARGPAAIFLDSVKAFDSFNFKSLPFLYRLSLLRFFLNI